MRNGFNCSNGFIALAREINEKLRGNIRYRDRWNTEIDFSDVYTDGVLFNQLVKWMGDALDEFTEGRVDFVAAPEVDGLGLAGALASKMSGDGRGTGYLPIKRQQRGKPLDRDKYIHIDIGDETFYIKRGIARGKRCVIVDDSANTYSTIVASGNLIGSDEGQALAAVSILRFLEPGDSTEDRVFEIYGRRVPTRCLIKYGVGEVVDPSGLRALTFIDEGKRS